METIVLRQMCWDGVLGSSGNAFLYAIMGEVVHEIIKNHCFIYHICRWNWSHSCQPRRMCPCFFQPFFSDNKINGRDLAGINMKFLGEFQSALPLRILIILSSIHSFTCTVLFHLKEKYYEHLAKCNTIFYQICTQDAWILTTVYQLLFLHFGLIGSSVFAPIFCVSCNRKHCLWYWLGASIQGRGSWFLRISYDVCCAG